MAVFLLNLQKPYMRLWHKLADSARLRSMKQDTKDQMTSMNISVPESMKEFIEEEVSSNGYGTASEYVRELVREAKRRKAEERLEALLLEALDSGKPIKVTPEYWENKKASLMAKYGTKANGKKP